MILTPWPAERVAELRRLVKLGLCDATIARRLGVSRRAVNGKRWRLQLDANWQRPRVTPPLTLAERRQAR